MTNLGNNRYLKTDNTQHDKFERGHIGIRAF